MKLHRFLRDNQRDDQQGRGRAESGTPLALAIGNFDGVHRGHQAILSACRNAASTLGFQPAAMTFAPLPREYFARVRRDAALAPPRLMSVTEKLAAFHRAGLSHVFIPRFNAAFAAQSPEAFMDSLRDLNVKWLMVGADFRFGAKRAGDVAMLRAYGAAHGITIETMEDIGDVGAGSNTGGNAGGNTDVEHARISSTAVRDALASGDCARAARLLGGAYTIIGRVIHGKKLGRTLGFPTANVALTRRKPAPLGVFAVKCRLVTRGLEGVAGEDGVILDGVANLGTNPVVSSENRHHLEVFLFEFSGDLYGKRVAVEFIGKIRDEQQFSGPDALNALVKQMHDDCDAARRILRNFSLEHGNGYKSQRAHGR
jgi:riboflavin kinase / FMN adenylyltransferase